MELFWLLTYPLKPSLPMSLNLRIKTIPPRLTKLLSKKVKTLSMLWNIREGAHIPPDSDSTTKSTTLSDMMKTSNCFTLKRYLIYDSGTRRSLCCNNQKLLHYCNIQHSKQDGERCSSESWRVEQESRGTC